MAFQQHERRPLIEDGIALSQVDPSYYTGIPNTAPPSFRSVASSIRSSILNRMMPGAPHQQAVMQDVDEDQGISLWGGSSVDSDLEAARDDTVALLLRRVEMLEGRLQEQLPNSNEKELDEGAERAKKRKNLCLRVGLTIGCTIFCLWLMAVVLLSVWARVEYAKNANNGLTATTPLKINGL